MPPNKENNIEEKRVKRTLELLEIDEPEGWDFFFGRRDDCCPGDNYAAVYNLALKDAQNALLNPDFIKDQEELLKEEVQILEEEMK